MYEDLINGKPNQLKTLYSKALKCYVLTMDEYKDAFKNIHFVTNITKYRDFQYRLLVHAIPANDRLFYWNKVESQSCEYCKTAKQSTRHLLFDCPKSALKMWHKLLFLFQTCLCGPILLLRMAPGNLFIGNVVENPGHIINFITLLMKQYLYAQKCGGKPLSFKAFLHRVDEMYNIEKLNAKTADKYRKHVRKWYPYTGLPGVDESTEGQNSEQMAIDYINNM